MINWGEIITTSANSSEFYIQKDYATSFSTVSMISGSITNGVSTVLRNTDYTLVGGKSKVTLIMQPQMTIPAGFTVCYIAVGY